jgi:hypothetical protein
MFREMVDPLETSASELGASDALVIDEQPVTIPTFRRERRCTIWSGIATASLTTLGICIDVLTGSSADHQRLFDAGLIMACVAGMLFLICTMAYLFLFCEDKQRQEAQKLLDDNPTLTYRMSVARAVVADNVRRAPTNAWNYFPWLDLLTPLPFYICIAAVPEARAKMIVLSISIVLWFVLICAALVLRDKVKISNACTKEICFLCFPSTSRIGILYGGLLTMMDSAGSRVPADGPGKLLGRSQLIGEHQDPLDETTPIVAWNLKLIYSSKESHWSTNSIIYPVDFDQASDFRRWLSMEPHKRMFGFCGATATKAHEMVVHTMFATLIRRPVLESQDDFDFQQQSLVLTAHISDGSEGQLLIPLTSIGGRRVLELRVEKSDTIADLRHMVAMHPMCLSSQVHIVLPSGRALNNMNGMSTLDTLVESAVV